MALLNAPILLLKEGTEATKGREQIISNINICQAIGDIVRTTLGPRGMDKLIHQERAVSITNDGATILGMLNVAQPVGKLLVELAKTQDDEVGDGTTSIVLIACELLQQAKVLLEEGITPHVIVEGYGKALDASLEHIQELAFSIDTVNQGEFRELLMHVTSTALQSKLLAPKKVKFSQMVVDAVMVLGEKATADCFAIKKISGGSIDDSFSVRGIAFKKTFSYAGFEQQPKYFKNPKILLLSVELELKAEKDNAEIRLTNVADYQSIVQAEWKIIYQKLDNCIATGAKIVLSKLPIGDLATQYFADHNIFCAGRVEEADLIRTAKATGGKIQNTTSNLSVECLGTCEVFEEKQLGDERWNIFTECPNSFCCTIVLRGCATKFIEEAERSLNDAIMVACRTLSKPMVVCGAGSVEMKLSLMLRDLANQTAGAQQFPIAAFAKALEVIPVTLAKNSGMDVTLAIGSLRKLHFEQPKEWWGVGCSSRKIMDAKKEFVWEPLLLRRSALQCATMLANLIVCIDETINVLDPNSPNKKAPQQPLPKKRPAVNKH